MSAKVGKRLLERWKSIDNKILAAMPISQNQVEFPIDQITGNLPVNEIGPRIGVPSDVSAIMFLPEWLTIQVIGFGVPVISQQLWMTCLVLSSGVPRIVMTPNAAGSSQILC